MELLAAHWVLTVVMAFATGWLLTRPGKSYMRDTKKNPYGKRIGKDVWRNVSNLEELETVPHSDVTTMWEALTFCAKKRKVVYFQAPLNVARYSIWGLFSYSLPLFILSGCSSTRLS